MEQQNQRGREGENNKVPKVLVLPSNTARKRTRITVIVLTITSSLTKIRKAFGSTLNPL